MTMSILLVDDEPALRLGLTATLTAAGYDVKGAADGRQALALAEDEVFDVVLCDVLLPGVDGLTVFKRIRKEHPNTDVIMMSAHGSIRDAVGALKDGATDFLTKPFEPAQLLHELGRIASHRRLRRELREARVALASRDSGIPLIGRSAVMRRLVERVRIMAASEAPVLVRGESGTGKELVARMLHQGSGRRTRAFIAVNCAAFPDTLLEAELFGHERGAFTGAVRKREGRFKAADGGTLFLDEVAELPLAAQAKLLRVLQSGEFEPVGADHSVTADVRVISATHRDLRRRIAEGTFREDLYYRLKVLEVTVPPLRDRPGDQPLLIEHFLRRFSPGDTVPGLTARAWAALSEYSFPGNVRELEHAIHHGVVLAGSEELGIQHLPTDIAGADDEHDGDAPPLETLAAASRSFEKEYLTRVLRRTQGNKGQAANLLGISRKNLWEKLRNHGLGKAAPGRDSNPAES